MNANPIIVIDDDADDLELTKQALTDLNIENEVIAFSSPQKFLDFMKQVDKIFFIICDMNMSPIDGLDLKKAVFEDEILRLKCMPFIFMSTSRGSYSVMKAYSYGVQGYFIKPSKFEELKNILLRIVEYWRYSQHPNI